MKTLKNDWVIGVIILLPFVFVATFWSQFPDEIATHFNKRGEPDNYSGKAFGLLLFPLVNLALYGMFKALPYIDPSKKNYSIFSGSLKIIQMTIHTFMTFIFFVIALYALGIVVDTQKVVFYGVLLLFLILGNYMSTLRQNYFVGIRTPWTLADETVWVKTHRLAGKLWVFSTLIMMVIIALLPDPYPVFIGYVLVIALVPTVYSYILFRKKEQTGNL